MTILVIGATGFIGTELTKIGRAAGHRMIGCGRSAWEGKNKALFPEKEDYWCTAEACLPAALLQQADCLVLLAAKRPYPGFCFEDYAENVAVAQRYMQLAMENGLKNIVFASSKAVYSGDERPWKEELFSAPFSLYGASKAAAEHLGLYYSAAGRLCFKSLRFAHVIGAGERKGYLINTLIDNAREKKPQVVFGSGAQKRQYVYVKDVAAAILAAAEKREISGVFNIAMPAAVSNLELAEVVNASFDNVGNLIHDYSRAMTGSDDEMSVEKAERVLGFRARYGIRETFDDLAKEIG